MKIKTALLKYLVFFFGFLLLFLGITPTIFAASYVINDDYSGVLESVTSCPLAASCTGPPENYCWNSENVGATTCGAACKGGTPWAKYEYKGCFVTNYDEALDLYTCTREFTNTFEQVCSTADKCVTSEPSYLNTGRCDCTSGSRYKTCCTNTSPSLVSSNTCATWDHDGKPPPEGVCPAGSDWVMCGVDQATCNRVNAQYGAGKCTTGPCGQAACGPVAPPRQCDVLNRSYNQCCGTGLSQHVDEYVWDDGSGEICRYDTGTCSQTDATCAPGVPPDTQDPTCNSLTLTDTNGTTITHGQPGTRVKINARVSDNVLVRVAETFKEPELLYTDFNTFEKNPYSFSRTWDTSGVAPGSYNIIANASDTSGNNMNGRDSGCIKPFTIDPPAPGWIGPSCSSGVFSGCTRQSGQICTDYGTPQDSRCADACSRKNPNTYCVPLTVSCSSSIAATTINWNSTVSGGTGSLRYSWTGTDGLSSTSSSVSKEYTTCGTKSATVTVTSGSESKQATCQNSVNACGSGGNISVPNINRQQGQDWPSTTIGISNFANPPGKVGWRRSGNDPTPGSCTNTNKCSDWADIRSNVTSSFPWTPDSSTSDGSYTFGLFKQLSDGSVNELLWVDTAIFSTGGGLLSPPVGVTCNSDANQSCQGFAPPKEGCSIVGGQPTLWCQQITANPRAICQYCPPPPPGPGAGCDYPTDSDMTAPTVSLLPDGHTVQINYNYGRADRDEGNALSQSKLARLFNFLNQLISPPEVLAGHIPPEVRFYRNISPGFISSGLGTRLGSQFGNQDTFFRDGTNTRRLYYYQVEADSGTAKNYSPIAGVVTSGDVGSGGKCSQGTNVNITSARQVSSGPGTITFELNFTSTGSNNNICGCPISGCIPQNTPGYLKITGNSSGVVGYVPWITGTGTCSRTVRQCGGTFCSNSSYTARYTVALPPGVSDSFSITGYEAFGCANKEAIGSTSFSGTAGAGTVSAVAPTITTITQATNPYKRQQVVSMIWSPTSATGQKSTVYEHSEAWPDGTGMGRAASIGRDPIVYTDTDDLSNLPAGTYYYGADLYSGGWCSGVSSTNHLKTRQTPFVWNPPTPAWIQTTGGDVHSNIRIQVPEEGP